MLIGVESKLTYRRDTITTDRDLLIGVVRKLTYLR
jgi:hypothetical protein